MLRRLFFSTAVIAVWFTGGVLLDGCRGVAMPALQPVGQVIVPTTVPALATAQESSASTLAPLFPTQLPVEKSSSKSVWLWNNVHLYQLDTRNGTLGERTDEVLGEPVSAQNKERQYFVTAVLNSGTWGLSLSGVALGSTEPVAPIALLEVPRTKKYVYDDATVAKPLMFRHKFGQDVGPTFGIGPARAAGSVDFVRAARQFFV